MELKRHICTEIKELRVHGRNSRRPLPCVPLFWTGAAVEINVTGRELWFEYTCVYNGHEGYLRIEIDGFDMFRFMLEEGTHKVCIYNEFEPEKVKNVRIYRENQASDTSITINSFYTDGEFIPLPERKHKIEFYGDSVTSGEGLAGSRNINIWIPAVFSSRGNYALRVAEELDADWSVISQSGWGYFCDWTGKTVNAIPRVYDKVCGPAKSDSQIALGANDPYDFENDKTDICIINLGANDASGFCKLKLTHEDGSETKIRKLFDGSIDPEDVKLLHNAVYGFCKKIREHKKDAHIIWCLGMLTDTFMGVIKAAAEQFVSENNDNKIHTIIVPKAPPELVGSRNHPGAMAHKMYADAITEQIKKFL